MALRKAKPVKVSDVYGYPTLSSTITEWVKKVGAKIVLVPEEVFTYKGPRIWVAGAGLLLAYNVPIIGYDVDREGVLRRTRLPRKWVTNEVRLYQHYLGKRIALTSKEHLHMLRNPEEHDTAVGRFHVHLDITERVYSGKVT